MGGISNADRDGTFEGRIRLDRDARSQHEPQCRQVAQMVRMLVDDSRDLPPGSKGEAGEWLPVPNWGGAVDRGNGVAMRNGGGMPEPRGDALFQRLRDHVFEDFGLGMHFFPTIA